MYRTVTHPRLKLSPNILAPLSVALANLVRSADSGAWSHQIGGALIGAHYYFVVKEKKNWDLARLINVEIDIPINWQNRLIAVDR